MALSRSFQNLQVLRSVKSWSITGTNKCLLFECTRLLHSTQGTFSEPELKPSEDYPNPVLHKQKIPPFVKDLFLGKFNKSLLSYAEILNDERFLQLENNVSQVRAYLDRNLDMIEQIDKTSKIHPDLLADFKQMGLFGMSVPAEHGGAELFFTEIGRYYEELGTSLALSDVVVTNESLGVRALMTAASPEVKKQYLPRVASGDCQVAWSLAEAKSGSDPAAVETTATLVGESWELSGTKTWVSNADTAQLFLVFARTRTAEGEEAGESISCFLVDRAEVDPDTVQLSPPYKLAGLRGVEACDVQFNKCKIPRSSVLGNVGEGLKIVQAVANQNKYLQTFPVIKYLKSLLNETIEHCNKREQFSEKLSAFSLVRMQLGQMSAALYALESAAYFTAGLADASLDADIEVESVITRQLATDTADTIVTTCLQLLGAGVNTESSKYQQHLRDTAVLQSWQGSTNINKCFVAISCLMHLIQHKPGVADVRQPANGNMIKAIKYQMNDFRHHVDRVVLPHNLYKCFGHGLQTAGRRLEWCAHKLPYVAEGLLVNHGANLQLEEVYLARLHDLATEVFTMTAVLSRASRSLTLGLDNFDIEATMATTFSYEAKQRVKQLSVDTVMCSTEESNRDEILEHSADYITRRGGYVAVHPLTKNSF